jgi:hypothetical protein
MSAPVCGKSEEIDTTAPALINHRPELMNWQRFISLVLLGMLAFSGKVEAERLYLKYGLTRPFYAPALNLQWTAPTNAVPRTVIVFKRVPDSHPEVTVANLMTIERFRPSESIKSFEPNMPLAGGAYGFRAADDGRWLVYAPQQGRIVFNNETAFHGPGSDVKVEGVPDEPTVLELALRLLPQLGISTNDMVKKASGELRCVFPTGSWGHTDKDTQIHRCRKARSTCARADSGTRSTSRCAGKTGDDEQRQGQHRRQEI